ncbi:MAG: ester cyclase [Solirubrobacterales bacterium]|nr:ester cyclase [Solirubrobacterales bacterium]
METQSSNPTALAVERLLRAFNDRDWEAMADSLDEDVEYRDRPLATVLRSPQEVVDWCRDGFVPFPDARLEDIRLITEGDRVASEFVERGTHTGPFEGPDGMLEPTGRTVEWRFCNVWRVGPSGKVIEAEAYYDQLDHLRQLGIEAS